MRDFQVTVTKRLKVMKRDGYKCCLCGRSPATTFGLILEVDHIRPISKGGTDHVENLQTLCFDCNRGKRDELLFDETQQNELVVENNAPTQNLFKYSETHVKKFGDWKLHKSSISRLSSTERDIFDILRRMKMISIIEG